MAYVEFNAWEMKRIASLLLLLCLMVVPLESTEEAAICMRVDLLYWSVHEGGLEYAIKNQAPIDNTLKYYLRLPQRGGSIQEAKQGWRGGCRVGLEYPIRRLECSGALCWTHYDHDRTDRSVAAQTQSLFALWLFPQPEVVQLVQSRSASMRWEIDYDMVTLEVIRPMTFGERFVMRPHWGVQGGWIRQRATIDYEDLVGRPVQLVKREENGKTRTIKIRAIPGIDNARVSLRNAFIGAGLTGGMGSDWTIGRGVRFYGDLATSLLCGRFCLLYREEDQLVASSVEIADVWDQYCAVRAVLIAEVGLRWHAPFAERYGVVVDLGWEEQLWFNQNQLNHFVDPVERALFFKEHGDLSFSGLRVSAKVEF